MGINSKHLKVGLKYLFSNSNYSCAANIFLLFARSFRSVTWYSQSGLLFPSDIYMWCLMLFVLPWRLDLPCALLLRSDPRLCASSQSKPLGKQTLLPALAFTYLILWTVLASKAYLCVQINFTAFSPVQ